jgi:hypothetical protein
LFALGLPLGSSSTINPSADSHFQEDVLYEYAKKTMDADLVNIERNPVPKKQDKIVLSFNYIYT